MAFNFNFGANVTNAITGIKQLQQQLMQLGLTAAQVNNLVSRTTINKLLFPPGQQLTEPLKAVENTTLRVIDRMARFLTAISGVKESLDLLFGAGSNVSMAFTALGEGVRVAANLAQLAKDNFGLMAAGLAGAAAAVILFTTAWVEARIKARDAITDSTEKSLKMIDAYKNALNDARIASDAFNDSVGERANKELSVARSALERNLETLRQLKVQLDKAVEAREKLEESPATGRPRSTMGRLVAGDEGQGGSAAFKEATQAIEALQLAMGRLEKQNEDIIRKASLLRLAADLGKFSTAAKEALIKLNAFQANERPLIELAEKRQKFAEFGENLPEQQRVENARKELELRMNILKNLEAQLDAAKKLDIAYQQQYDTEGLSLDLSEDWEKNTQSIKTLMEQIGTAISNIVVGQRQLHQELAPEAFTKRFTEPFADSISNALVQGIVNGEKAAAIFANVSKNLLTAALNDVMKNFKQGMIDVFKDIAGAGGELLGSALITVVGVVAGVLGRQRSSTDTFNSIKNQIESTEAVRGIVAGPSNVAIASVGDNLKRAVRGVEVRLDELITIGRQQLATSGSSALAGSVTTP